MGKMAKTENPDKVGLARFWLWQTAGASSAVLFIMQLFLMIYCTNTLGISAALVGTLLMVSKIFDGVTDLFAGYIVEKHRQRWERGVLMNLPFWPHGSVHGSCTRPLERQASRSNVYG